MRLQIEILILVILFSIYILYSVKKDRLTMKYATLWLIASFIVFVMVLFPSLLKLLNLVFKFEVISNMIFFGGFILLTFIIFSLTIIVSTQSRKIRILTQEVSILKNEIKK